MKKNMKKKRTEHKGLEEDYRKKTVFWVTDLIATTLLVAGVLVYIFLPFDLTLTIVNEKGDPIIGHITINTTRGETVFEGDRHVLELPLWKGDYTITVSQDGYVDKELMISNPVALRRNRDLNETMTLAARRIRMNNYAFFDPTTSIELGPRIHMMGKDVLGDYHDEDVATDGTIIYGDYIADMNTDHFTARELFAGDAFIQDMTPTHKIILKPNQEFYILTPTEVQRIQNYMKDYMDLSASGDLAAADRGMPRQGYIYSQDIIVPLGDMIFLLCQDKTYSAMGREPTYFIPKDRTYWFEDGTADLTTCYGRTLIGAVPHKIGQTPMEDTMYQILGGTGPFKYRSEHLNSRIRGIQVSFTFDVESGRYVPEDSQYAVSPCTGDEWSLGLSPDELVCDKPEYVAWMSPRAGKHTFDEYTYPHVSGIIGYRQIVSYADRYGIPVTNYYVKKDVVAYSELEPALIEKTKQLISEGLIEVGSHTRYHTHLGMVKKATARTELKESREWLQDFFNTTVVGIRGPYHSMIGDEKTHAAEVGLAGYSYFTQYGEYSGKVPGSEVEHKQWRSDWRYAADIKPSEMRELLWTQPYIMTLDHPWNMAYKDADRLVEDPSSLVRHKANVLTLIANGGIPVPVRDLKVETSYTPTQPVQSIY